MADIEFSKQLSTFSNNVLNKLIALEPNQNIVFSPFSIQTCTAMARMGAEYETADEIDLGLGFATSDINEIANKFAAVLGIYENSKILHIANKIYVMEGYTVRSEFNQLLATKFHSSADEIDFAKNAEAAAAINGWVQSRTNNLIRDLVPADALNVHTRLVLLNAIHFKGEWVQQFPKSATRDENFYLNESDAIKVPMMNMEATFRYGLFPELNATALEMPYKDSDLSMLIILPNTRTGLGDLEQGLKTITLTEITQRLFSTKVIVKLPRFKAEFKIELNEAFKQLGMRRIFSDCAQFGKMLNCPEPLHISKIIHKAFIDVNEEGTEAAAATGLVMTFDALTPETSQRFFVDKPFQYSVISKSCVQLFAGRTLRI